MTSKKSTAQKIKKKKNRTTTNAKSALKHPSPEISAGQTVVDAESERRLTKRKFLVSIVLLVVILMSALWLRTDDLISWYQHPHRAFFNEQPILINFDGYYYLSLARDLMQGTYDPVHALRGVPQSPPRPFPPPLMSVVAAMLGTITPVSLNWIATLLPPLLGIALAIPLFLLSRLYAGRTMALAAVAMGLFPSYYVYRSNLGWFDTDCLNVTFLLLVCYFFIRFGIEQGRRRYAFLAGGAVTYLLFMLWWDQTPAVVTLICLSPLIIVILLYYRPTGREKIAALVLGTVALAGVMIWQGPKIIVAPFQKAVGQFSYISKQQSSDFPNVGVSVHEQRHMALKEIISKTTAHPLSFVIGLAGLAGLFWQHKRRAAALMVPFAIGCLTFLFARRFLIFLNPFLAIGFGFAAHWLWQLRLRWPALRYVVPLIIFVLLFIPFKGSLGKFRWPSAGAAQAGQSKGLLPKLDRVVYWPKEMPPIVEGMDAVNRLTDEASVVWAWWDHGYPMLYWAERATINDGSLHGGLRTVINGIPLAAHQPKLAANFMRFYTVRGTKGMARLFETLESSAKGMAVIEQVLSAEEKDVTAILSEAGLTPAAQWRSFFFPEKSHELYLFLDLRLARTVYWWHWFGTWDVASRDGIHPQFKFIPNCIRNGDVVFGAGIQVNLEQGQARWKNAGIKFSAAWVHDGKQWHQKAYPHDTDMIFVYTPQTRLAYIMDKSFTETLFANLYIFENPDPRYFSLVSENFPYYQIWKVHLPNVK